MQELEARGLLQLGSATACLEIGSGSGGGGVGVGGIAEYLLLEAGSEAVSEATSERRHVTLIDPGRLRGTLTKIMEVERELTGCFEHRQGRWEDVQLEEGQMFDLCVCDSPCEIDNGVRMVKTITKRFHESGIVVLTFKWNDKYGGKKCLKEMVMQELIECGFVSVEEYFLFANQKHERTIVARVQ